MEYQWLGQNCSAENGKCYNRTTGFEVRQIVKGGYTRGYNLAGHFTASKSYVRCYGSMNRSGKEQTPEVDGRTIGHKRGIVKIMKYIKDN